MAALPPLPPLLLAFPGVPAPAPPQNPPTLTDIANAHEYNVRLVAARDAARLGPGGLHGPGVPTAINVAQGLVYEKTLIELTGGPGVMPAWFQAWDTNHFQPHVRSLAAFRSQSANRLHATGHETVFQIILFENGDNPTTPPHSLPALVDTDEIGGLTRQQVTAYLRGYGLARQGTDVARTRRLARHIGYLGEV
ncbi:hypothetical protein B0H12DRAFT_1146983 [Mycena haematopus]|nr:hypothetical protein B0H12DRAFT_1146983 [Mycena haematopus]